MKFSPWAGFIAAAFSLSSLQAADASHAEWVPLFNGKDLNGWTQRGGNAKYSVAGDEIVGACVPNTPNSFLCTTRAYTNFVLELEFKVADELNSGIQVRSECFDTAKEMEFAGKKIKIPAGRVHGYQFEIDPSGRAWTGGLYDEGRRGWLQDLKTNDVARAAFKKGAWNKFHIECQGDSLKSWLNDVPIADYKDGLTPAGFIALQVHGVGKKEETMEVHFRHLRIKEQ
ncbi:MAG TPA: DUF1080 domain-containing protein [Candidatus Limnocylindria bacterium]|jgi:hypothetical protein|nr:DUF1080 domain-containing protein [Candidatus Limnocylindria bacterium]